MPFSDPAADALQVWGAEGISQLIYGSEDIVIGFFPSIERFHFSFGEPPAIGSVKDPRMNFFRHIRHLSDRTLLGFYDDLIPIANAVLSRCVWVDFGFRPWPILP